MALFKSISEKARLILIVLTVLAVGYGTAWAIINIGGRIPTGGKGLISNTDGTNDSIDVNPGWGIQVINDQTRLNALSAADSLVSLWSTQTIVGTKTFTSASGVVIGVNGQDGILTLYAEDGGTDHSVIFQPSTMTQNVTYTLPPDDGTSGYVLRTDGNGVLTWVAAGVGDMLTSTYDVAVNGKVDDVDTIGTQINAALVKRNNPGWHLYGVANTLAPLIIRPGYVSGVAGAATNEDYLTFWQSAAPNDTFGIGVDTVALMKKIYKCMEDSLGLPTYLPETGRLSIREGVDDSIGIYYPVASDSIDWMVWHKCSMVSTTANNQIDTVVFSRRLPKGMRNIDSITFDAKMSFADSTGGVPAPYRGISIRIFKRDGVYDYMPPALLATSAGMKTKIPTYANVWTHFKLVNTTDFTSPSTSGNHLAIYFLVKLNAAQSIWHTEPRIWTGGLGQVGYGKDAGDYGY